MENNPLKMVEQTVDVITYTTDTTNRKQKSGYLNKMPLLFLYCFLNIGRKFVSILIFNKTRNIQYQFPTFV